MAHSKYVAIYNGLPIPFDDIGDFARKVMGFRVVEKDDGHFTVVVNGQNVAHYTDEWTRQEVEKDYLKSFLSKWTRKNLAFYTIVGK